jgi:hypothetical protein
MAQYRSLQPICANGLVDPISGQSNWPWLAPNTLFSDTAGDGYFQGVPSNWPPSAVDPLNQDAINKLWAQGPCQLQGLQVAFPPLIYWVAYPAGGGTSPYILTGAGAALGFRNWTSTRGAAP